ncbi:hypothetical protein HMI55_004453 [Coelomomyces lativittatus]|nr:hypothetical protein HMI55_004453 [Coelomomyces lativittatus]
MDSIGVKRAWNSDESGSVDDRVLSTVLNEMDGIGSREGVMIIGCTHRPFDMDDALLRPGRLDHLIYFRMPTYQDRLKILQLTFPSTERLLNLAKEMVGCTPADLLFLIRESLSVSTKKSEKDQAMTNPPDLEGFELTWKKYSSFFGQARRQALEAPYLNFQESRKL